ncbi:MAG: hypothetical protein ACTHQE_08165 [Thermomicrobiales bacterium]
MSDSDPSPTDLTVPADPSPRPTAESASAPRLSFPKPIAGRIVVPGAHPGDGHDAVTLPPDALPGVRKTRTGIRWSPTATLCLLLAIAVLVAVELIGADSGFRTFRYGVWLATTMLVLATVASCLPNALWREGSLLAWNALGLTIGVLALGVLGVSSMLALPPVLVGIALTSWPHPPLPETPAGGRGVLAVDTGQRVVLVSGLLVIPLLALVEWLFLRGGRG